MDPLSINEKQYSSPLVRKELASKSLAWMRFNTAVENGRLQIIPPKNSFLKKVEEASKEVGDVLCLSDADMEVLALALQLKSAGLDPLIVTDDYSIQNVANKLGLNFASLMTYGIRLRFDWILYCPACYRKYPTDYKFDSCEVCGTKIKRKPLRKKPLNKTN